jgi:hypothetical protein
MLVSLFATGDFIDFSLLRWGSGGADMFVQFRWIYLRYQRIPRLSNFASHLTRDREGNHDCQIVLPTKPTSVFAGRASTSRFRPAMSAGSNSSPFSAGCLRPKFVFAPVIEVPIRGSRQLAKLVCTYISNDRTSVHSTTWLGNGL